MNKGIERVFLLSVIILGLANNVTVFPILSGNPYTNAFAESSGSEGVGIGDDVQVQVNATNDESEDTDQEDAGEVNATNNEPESTTEEPTHEEKMAEHETRMSAPVEDRETKATQTSEELLQKLQQQIDELEQRLQSLLEKFQTGEYFGTTLGGDSVTKSYDLSFEGSATSTDGSQIEEVSGDIFLDTLVTRDDVTKFRVTGGDILIGTTYYDLVFGKARVTVSPESGAKDSMVLLAQLVDDDGNYHTLKIFSHTAMPLEGEFGAEPINVDIKIPQSNISDQWNLSASGKLSLIG